MSLKSLALRVSSGTSWTLAVAAMARSSARRRGCPPRVRTAAARRPHSRATAASIGSGSKVDSIDAEAQRAAGALVVVAGDQDAEVQLGEAGGADRALELAGVVGADQHRRVEQRAHLRERVGELGREALEVLGERLRARASPRPWRARGR